MDWRSIINYSSLRKEDDKWTKYWDAIKRFSPWATGAVIVIVITGLLIVHFYSYDPFTI